MITLLKRPEPEPELFPEFPVSLRPPSGQLKALDAPLYQVAPGVWVSGMPAFEMPSHILCRVTPVAGEPGKFTLEPDGPYPGYIRMSETIGKQLGVLNLSTTCVRRLMAGGFVDHLRIAPGCLFISIESLLEHFKRTANDGCQESSWWTPARQKVWKATFEGISNFEE